ncbi:MAG: GntR family transcriptional regulator [Reyranellaceae bacterium]
MPKTLRNLRDLPSPDPGLLDSGTTLADRCGTYLKGLLLDGGLEPGQPISIAAVTRAMGVSRQPVMDAVRRLEIEGFIQVLPQIGCRVVAPQAEAVGDFFQFFARAEGLVCRLAAQRRSEEQAGALQALADSVLRESSIAGPPDSGDPTYRHLNRRLHNAIHDMARSPIASEISASMWDRSDFYSRAAFGTLYFAPAVRRAHAAIVAAIVARDADTADSVTVAHLSGVGERAVKRLKARLGITD